MMLLRSLCVAATLATHGAAITLLGVLQSYPELHDFYSFVNSSANATALLANANDFTFFAPSTDAIQAQITEDPTVFEGDSLVALLQYSLLKGTFPSLSFSNTSQFVKTNLDNSTYANVTGGQALELVLGDNGRPTVITGNKSVSTAPSTEILCSGGIVQIIDTVPSIPIPAVLEITAAHLEYFISILSMGNYLNTANDFYVNAILEVPDITYFIPNSAAAVANATEIVKNASATELQAMFQYHIVPNTVAYSTDLKNGTTYKTAQGDDIHITVQGEDIFVNAAKVTSTDWIVSNGVIHVIEDLLNRNDTSPPPPPVSSLTSSSSNSSPTSSPTSSSTPSPTVKSDQSGTSSPTSTPSAGGGGGGLSTGAKIGIGIGVAIVGLLALGALAGFFLRDRRQKKADVRDSGVWDNNQDMSGMPDATGKYYVKRGTIQRQEDMGLGLQSTGMHGIATGESPTSPPYTATASGPGSRPHIPPRSPSRALQGNEF